jgi:hypothetical protein
MNTVFVLQHEYEWHGRDEVKFIGVYASRAHAEAAAARLREQPAFRDWPEGFSVNLLVPSKRTANSYQVAISVWCSGDLYEISDLDEPEHTVFSVGDVVRCETRSVAGYGESALVAIELVRAGALHNVAAAKPRVTVIHQRCISLARFAAEH